MKPVTKLDKKSAESLMIELLNETLKPPTEPYNSPYNRERVAMLRQSIKILEIFVLNQEWKDLEDRIWKIERTFKDIDEETSRIRIYGRGK